MRVFLFVSLLLATIFSGCSSTTQGGAVGADRSQIMLVSESQMNQSAKLAYSQTLSQAKSKGSLNKSKNQTERVRYISKRLINHVGVFRQDALNWDWQVNVIESDEMNAWCMPGGKIAVYSGIINKLQLNDAQLAAIIGHEMAHALREHSREQASRDMIKNGGLIALSAFGYGDVANLANLATTYTVSLPFSRDNEYEADRIGTELMARAGYDPNEAIVVWQKMIKASGSQSMEFMSTHPLAQNRINDLKVTIKKLEPIYLSNKK